MKRMPILHLIGIKKSRLESALQSSPHTLWRILNERDITMTDVKLAQVNSPMSKDKIADCSVNLWLDWASRAAIVIVYGGFAFIGVAGVPRLLPLDSVHKLLMIAASIANILFVSLVVATTITRLIPIKKSKGIEARISALLGTF